MYLEIDEGFDSHPKTVRMCRVMRDVNAGQYLIRLWAWACRSAQDGDISGMQAPDIEAICRYRKADGKLFAALCEVWSPKFGPWIDVDGETMNLHGWGDRQGAAIAKMQRHADKMKMYRAGRDWEKVRHEVILRDGGKCSSCGVSGELDVHHKIPLSRFKTKEAGNARSNLITLCPACHVRAENEYRALEKREQCAHGAVTVMDRPDQTSQDKTSLREEGDPEPPPTVTTKTAHDWLSYFQATYWSTIGRQYGQGSGDAKSVANLADLLETLPPQQRVEDWNDRERIVGEFLKRDDVRTVRSGHPFAFFVTDFRGLAMPLAKRPRAQGSPSVGFLDASKTTHPVGYQKL
jgi:hypothetical protein